MTDTKHRAVSLQQQSYLWLHPRVCRLTHLFLCLSPETHTTTVLAARLYRVAHSRRTDLLKISLHGFDVLMAASLSLLCMWRSTLHCNLLYDIVRWKSAISHSASSARRSSSWMPYWPMLMTVKLRRWPGPAATVIGHLAPSGGMTIDASPRRFWRS